MIKFRVTRYMAVFFCIALLQAANAQTKEGASSTKQSFTSFYNTVNKLLTAKNWKELKKYVHPSYGYYVYDNPGVRPQAANYKVFEVLVDVKGYVNETIIAKLRAVNAETKQKLQSGKVPVWDCGTEKWNKKGNYVQDISSYQELTETVLYSPGCDENPKHPDVVRASQFSKIIKKHVIQTDGYDIYFAFANGKWYIAVINLCDKCSA